ncbi:MAG: hypothetical protein FJY09_10430 [Chlorobi bacterium]|nr:hypothetical protein [Chlorobiota bacterium]
MPSRHRFGRVQQRRGSRNRQCSLIRKQLAGAFVEEQNMSYAGAARLLGISASAENRKLMREHSAGGE